MAQEQEVEERALTHKVNMYVTLPDSLGLAGAAARVEDDAGVDRAAPVTIPSEAASAPRTEFESIMMILEILDEERV